MNSGWLAVRSAMREPRSGGGLGVMPPSVSKALKITLGNFLCDELAEDGDALTVF